MDFCISLVLFFIYLLATLAQEQEVMYANIVIDGSKAIRKVDNNFICVTIDWWPHDKCNYNQCPWGYSSAINLNLSHLILTELSSYRGSKLEDLYKTEYCMMALVTFGLNSLHGRHRAYITAWGGDWDSSNAYDFIKYTVSKGYHIDLWEFGNELSGSDVGARVSAKQYGKDLIKLRKIINKLDKKFHLKPMLTAPRGFYDKQWFTKLL